MGDERKLEEKATLVKHLLQAKEQTGKTFTQIAAEAVPTLSSELLHKMKVIPMRSYDPNILQDPTIYRFNEATAHYAESIKAIINEEFGDGIMSAIGFYCTVEKIKGKEGEDRVAVVFNGKFLPHVVQKAEDNTVKLQNTKAWGKVRDQEVLVFFDPGARATFISPELASKLGIRAEEMGMTGEAGLACPGHSEAVTPVLGKLRLHIQG
ncbi:hypothetical protein L7F22_036245 [Adiantum nelumboides]|nr:hypothetical protein [Adiantum nelumboides]